MDRSTLERAWRSRCQLRVSERAEAEGRARQPAQVGVPAAFNFRWIPCNAAYR